MKKVNLFSLVCVFLLSIHTVSATKYYVKQNGEAQNDGLSWKNATTLDQALSLAQNDGDEIHLAQGTYVPTVCISAADGSDERDKTFELKKNISLTGGYSSTPTDSDIPNPSKYRAILSAQLNATTQAYHVLVVTSQKSDNASIKLSGLVLQDAQANGTKSYTINGNTYKQNTAAGLQLVAANVELSYCDIVNNNSTGGSAGAFIDKGCNVKFDNVQVTNNISTGNAAGMWVQGASTLKMYNSVIKKNETTGAAGGLQMYGASFLYMYNCAVVENKANGMAGLYLRNGSKGLIVNTTFFGNNAGTANGSAIMVNEAGSDLKLINSTLSNNSGNGALQNRLAAHIYNSIIAGNRTSGTSSPDLQNVGTSAVTNIYNSIVSEKYTDKTGAEQETPVFELSDLFDTYNETNSIVPLKETSAAIDMGYTTDGIKTLMAGIVPAEDMPYLEVDQLGRSRSNSPSIGAWTFVSEGSGENLNAIIEGIYIAEKTLYVTDSNNGMAYIYNISTGQLVFITDLAQSRTDLSFLPQGKYILILNKKGLKFEI